MEQDDLKQLFKKICDGDHEAFRQFFDLYYPRLYQFSFHLTGSDVLSEEAVSDVFVKLWMSRERLETISNINTYLFVSVKNQSLTYLGKKKFSSITEIPESKQILREQPESILTDKELSETIFQVVEALPDRCKVIYRLIKEDGLSYKQVAELLNISKKTVQAQMVIALKRIRAVLKSYEFF